MFKMIKKFFEGVVILLTIVMTMIILLIGSIVYGLGLIYLMIICVKDGADYFDEVTELNKSIILILKNDNERLIKKVKNDFSNYKLVITTGTVTGQELAHKKYGELADFITYFPLDVYEACKKFIEAIKPSVVLIAETELWPNFAYACQEKERIVHPF